MHIKQVFRKTLIPALTAAFLVVCMLVSTAGPAQAATATSIVDTSCNTLDTQGFTVGLVYCVQTSIGKAVNKYVTYLQNNAGIKLYMVMMMTVAICLFGIKLMTSNVQYVMKESMTLAFRIVIGMFFFYQANNIYNDIVGVPPNGNGMINEAIGWVTGLTSSGGIGSGGSGSLFGNLISSNCTPTDPAHKYSGYQVWQAFDCMFTTIMGAANPSTHPQAFATSLLVIIGAALFSSTLGVIAAFAGISVIISALMMVMRALFLVLMSYITVGFMVIFTPLIAPLIFFDNQYMTERFMSWASIIFSAIIQPVFIIGFLAMAVAIDDQLIEGQLPGCSAPTYPKDTSVNTQAPPAGWGQDGKGVCSYTQLMYNGISPKTDGSKLRGFFDGFTEMSSSLFSWTSNQDYQNKSINGGIVSATTGSNSSSSEYSNPATSYNTGMCGSAPCAAGPVSANQAEITVSTPHLNKSTPMRQVLLTLLTFMFVNFVLKKLMDIIPVMAQNMTLSASTGLYRAVSVPFEETIQTLQGSTKRSVIGAMGGPTLGAGRAATMNRPAVGGKE